MAGLALGLFLVALAGVVWQLRLRSDVGPVPLWMGGWLILLASALNELGSPGATSGPSLTHLGAPLLPALILAGALVYAGSAVPRWLFPGALLLGLARLGLAAAGQEEVGHAVALAVEPPLCLAAAVLVTRATPQAGSAAQRLLPVTFGAVALLEAISAVHGLLGNALSPPVLLSWLGLGVVTAGVQVAAAGDLARARNAEQQSERRRMREALSRSEERFRALTENAFDLVAETDAEGRILYANPNYARCLLGAEGPLEGRSTLEWIHPADRPAARAWYRELVRTGSAAPALARWRHRDGSCRWLESAGRTFEGPDGALRAVICSRDVTERKRMEEELAQARAELEQRVEERTAELAAAVSQLKQENAARVEVERKLRRSQERYRLLSELSSDLSFAFRVGPNGTLIGEWVTDAFQRITGYEPKEILARGWQSLAHPDDLDAVREHLEAAAEGAERSFESRIVTRDGQVRWLHSRLVGVRGERDGGVRVVGAVRDITERKRAEEERRKLELRMQEAQKLESLGMLAGGIAHDFNNLLSVILGNASLSAAELGPGSPGAARIARIRSAAEHAAGLTEQILAYSGKATLTLKPLDLSRLVADLLDLMRASVSKKCSLEAELAPGLPAVEGDLTQMRQVLLNLVTNAAESHEGRSGRVTLRTGSRRFSESELAHGFGAPHPQAGEYVFLEVQDEGRGIAPETRGRIFEPFFTTKFSGRGLGLAAVLGIVRQHGGVIQVESPPGRGALFRVLLPAATRPCDAPIPRAREARRPSGQGSGCVLVVDDEEPVLELASEILERAGFRVLRAEGGEVALRLFRAHASEIDVVLLDLTMPGVDGEETLRGIRAERAETPVILTSGYSREAGGGRSRSQSLAGFLRKPYDPEELVEKVRATIDA